MGEQPLQCYAHEKLQMFKAQCPQLNHPLFREACECGYVQGWNWFMILGLLGIMVGVLSVVLIVSILVARRMRNTETI